MSVNLQQSAETSSKVNIAYWWPEFLPFLLIEGIKDKRAN